MGSKTTDSSKFLSVLWDDIEIGSLKTVHLVFNLILESDLKNKAEPKIVLEIEMLWGRLSFPEG